MNRFPADHHYGHGAVSRRAFLRRSLGVAASLPSAAAILAACSKPASNSPVPSGSRNPLTQPASPNNPITFPMVGEPLPDSTPIEKNATLKLYNWGYYLWPELFKQRFEQKYNQYNVKVELTTFNNEAEAVQKLQSGAVQADVTFPTVYVVGQEALGKLLQPLNHNLIPNLASTVWPEFQNPWYDQGWRYTVPYVIWTTGIAYRRDHVDDAAVAAQRYSILWDPKYKGKVGFYDTDQNAIAMALLKNGISDVNTGNAADINTAKEDLIKLVQDNGATIETDGVWSKLPADQIWVHQAWSGDIVAARLYLPKGVSTDVLGYWYPPEGGGVVGNDLMAIPASAQNPRLAHEFLNFMLDPTNAFDNFTNYTGYQPPQNNLAPNTLVPKDVPATVASAVVTRSALDAGQYLVTLPPATNQLWLNAWDEIKAGA